jgi:dimethylglycine dehydrogenase
VSVAMGYVPKAIADEPNGWSVEILGQRYPARLQQRPLFDPEGTRLHDRAHDGTGLSPAKR